MQTGMYKEPRSQTHQRDIAAIWRLDDLEKKLSAQSEPVAINLAKSAPISANAFCS